MRKMKWRRTRWMMMIYDDVEKRGEHDVEDGDVLEDDEKDNNVAEDEVEEDDVAEDQVEDDGVEDDDVKGGKLMIVKMMIMRRRTDPKTEDHTLCETARSKCTWTCQKSHFKQKFTGKILRPRLGPERGHTLCASLRSRNSCPHVTGDIR